MKCTNNKKRLLCLFVIAAIFISGCKSKEVSYDNPYDIYDSSISVGTTVDNKEEHLFFSEEQELIVLDDMNFGQESDAVHSNVMVAAGAFNLATDEVTFSQNIYDKMFPASTTKIMTCYLALKYGNLNDYVTISKNAADQPSDASVCHVNAGDVISLNDLLYGLMLASGNDAAIAIAEHISGSVEAFVELMNEEAIAMGASCTHFDNPHGMPSAEHYTSVYDLYIIFKNAIENDEFVNIINTTSYTATITNIKGDARERSWENSNRFTTGKTSVPDGFTIIGGKTGTTGEAGYCLVMLSENSASESIISIVLKADGRSNLYLVTREILKEFNN